MALTMPLCAACQISDSVASLFLWLGYFNSTLNPVSGILNAQVAEKNSAGGWENLACIFMEISKGLRKDFEHAN